MLQNKVYAVSASIFHEVYNEEILRITVTKTQLSQMVVCNICKTTVRNTHILDEVTYDGIVEILNVGPLNTL